MPKGRNEWLLCIVSLMYAMYMLMLAFGVTSYDR